jgi:hypothetical protein
VISKTVVKSDVFGTIGACDTCATGILSEQTHRTAPKASESLAVGPMSLLRAKRQQMIPGMPGMTEGQMPFGIPGEDDQSAGGED